MPVLYNLPAIEAPRNALLDFSGINNAIDDWRKRNELETRKQDVRNIGDAWQNKNYDQATNIAFRSGDPQLAMHTQQMAQQQQTFDEARQKDAIAKMAAISQYIDSVKDPAQQKLMHDRWISSHEGYNRVLEKLPEHVRSDPIFVRQYFQAVARGYKDPLEEKMKLAQIAQANSQVPMNTAHAELFRAQARQADQKPPGDVKEVNGKLVYIPPDRKSATEIYNAGPDLSKTPEHVAKSANFAARMIDSEEKLQAAMKDPAKYNPTTIGTATVNSLPEAAANYFRSPEGQKYMQSAREWIRAYLRRESGAAISADEFRQDFLTFFPQPNDGPEVVEQKRQARMLAAQGIANEARDVFPHLAPRQAEILKKWGTNAPQTPATTRPRARNPQTGQVIEYDGQQWVPVK